MEHVREDGTAMKLGDPSVKVRILWQYSQRGFVLITETDAKPEQTSPGRVS
jgi:hypothetical protein